MLHFTKCYSLKSTKSVTAGIHVLQINSINSLSTRDEKAEFANSVDLDEMAHNEPPHQDLHCLPSSL